MSNAFAEELKQRGNEAFAAKRFEDAIVLYDKAIEADENNYIYYNNRAAAYHELKNYDKAIADANRSLSIEDNSKGHARLGTTFWAQMKYREAKAEFQKVASLDPENKSAKDNIQKLEQLLNPMGSSSGYAQRHGVPHPSEYARAAAASNSNVPKYGGEFVSVDVGVLGVVADVIVVFLSALHFFSSLFVPSMAPKVWQVFLVVVSAQQLMTMRFKGLLQLNRTTLMGWVNHFSSLVFCICVGALLLQVQSVSFLPIFVAMYSLVDLINKKQMLAALLGPIYPMVQQQVITAEEKKDSILLMAATVESILTFTIMLSGGTFYTLLYIQYSKYRYTYDGYVKLAFKGLRMNATRFTQSSWMPAVVDVYAQKFFDLLGKIAEQPF